MPNKEFLILKNSYWTESMRKKYSIDKKDIFMDESIKSTGNHYVTIHLGEELDPKVKIKVKSETIK